MKSYFCFFTMLYISEGIRLERLEEIFDREETEFLQKVGHLAYPSGKELRKIADKIGGKWELSENGTYDVINMPFSNAGMLIIERPFPCPEKKECKGHKVAYSGKIYPGFEEQLIYFVENLLSIERFTAREDFLQYEAEPTDNKEWVRETAKLFDK